MHCECSRESGGGYENPSGGDTRAGSIPAPGTNHFALFHRRLAMKGKAENKLKTIKRVADADHLFRDRYSDDVLSSVDAFPRKRPGTKLKPVNTPISMEFS